ncbi:hypothetical protein AKJ16_DCAP10662 [Drosera capensis]
MGSVSAGMQYRRRLELRGSTEWHLESLRPFMALAISARWFLLKVSQPIMLDIFYHTLYAMGLRMSKASCCGVRQLSSAGTNYKPLHASKSLRLWGMAAAYDLSVGTRTKKLNCCRVFHHIFV